MTPIIYSTYQLFEVSILNSLMHASRWVGFEFTTSSQEYTCRRWIMITCFKYIHTYLDKYMKESDILMVCMFTKSPVPVWTLHKQLEHPIFMNLNWLYFLQPLILSSIWHWSFPLHGSHRFNRYWFIHFLTANKPNLPLFSQQMRQTSWCETVKLCFVDKKPMSHGHLLWKQQTYEALTRW